MIYSGYNVYISANITHTHRHTHTRTHMHIPQEKKIFGKYSKCEQTVLLLSLFHKLSNVRTLHTTFAFYQVLK